MSCSSSFSSGPKPQEGGIVSPFYETLTHPKKKTWVYEVLLTPSLSLTQNHEKTE
jgi:hypothetical protein